MNCLTCRAPWCAGLLLLTTFSTELFATNYYPPKGAFVERGDRKVRGFTAQEEELFGLYPGAPGVYYPPGVSPYAGYYDPTYFYGRQASCRGYYCPPPATWASAPPNSYRSSTAYRAGSTACCSWGPAGCQAACRR